MKIGDLVWYMTLGDLRHQVGDFPRQDEIWTSQGLLISFDKVHRICEILDETGKIIRKHCDDVRPMKVRHASR